MNTLFQILVVLGLTVLAGFLLTVGLVFGGFWQMLEPIELLDWFSKYLKLFSLPILIIMPPLFIGLLGSLILNWKNKDKRFLWITVLAAVIINGVITSTVNAVINGQFESKLITPDQVPMFLNKWLIAHWARTAVVIIGSVVAIIAIKTNNIEAHEKYCKK